MPHDEVFAGKPLLDRALSRAEYERTHWFVRVEPGVSLSAVTHPDFWVNTANKMKAGDLIEVVAQDGSFDAELRVTKAERLYAKVRIIRLWELTDQERLEEIDTGPVPEVPPEYRVEFGGRHKWRAVDRFDNIIVKGLSSEVEAKRALAAFLAEKQAA